MKTELPPIAGIEKEIALVPASMRDDAIQEAWLAHLEGRSASAAISTYVKREKRFLARHLQIDGDESGNQCAVTKSGKFVPLESITPAGKSNSSRRKITGE